MAIDGRVEKRDGDVASAHADPDTEGRKHGRAACRVSGTCWVSSARQRTNLPRLLTGGSQHRDTHGHEQAGDVRAGDSGTSGRGAFWETERSGTSGEGCTTLSACGATKLYA